MYFFTYVLIIYIQSSLPVNLVVLFIQLFYYNLYTFISLGTFFRIFSSLLFFLVVIILFSTLLSNILKSCSSLDKKHSSLQKINVWVMCK